MSIQVLKKLTPSLKEVRIHLCPKTSASNGTRQFIEKHYLDIKQNNPNLPILIRECTGVDPKIWFRFEYGEEINVPLRNLNPEQIVNVVNENVKST